jgi:hypothetical protein
MFGGKPGISHWSINLRYKAFPGETLREQNARRKSERDILRAAAIVKDMFYQFRDDDPVGKEIQRRKALAKAAEIEAQTGIKMEVNEGCFL